MAASSFKCDLFVEAGRSLRDSMLGKPAHREAFRLMIASGQEQQADIRMSNRSDFEPEERSANGGEHGHSTFGRAARGI